MANVSIHPNGRVHHDGPFRSSGEHLPPKSADKGRLGKAMAKREARRRDHAVNRPKDAPANMWKTPGSMKWGG